MWTMPRQISAMQATPIAEGMTACGCRRVHPAGSQQQHASDSSRQSVTVHGVPMQHLPCVGGTMCHSGTSTRVQQVHASVTAVRALVSKLRCVSHEVDSGASFGARGSACVLIHTH